MDSVTKISGIEYAIGLTWETLSPDLRRGLQIETLGEKYDTLSGVIRKRSGQVQVGFSQQKGISAAALLADAAPADDLMYIERVSGGYWLCVISDGIVLPGGDIFIDNKLNLIEQVLEMSSLIDLKLICIDDEILNIEAFSEYKKQRAEFAQLVEGVKTGAAKIGSLETSRKLFLQIAAGAAAVIVLSIIISYAVDFYKQSLIEREHVETVSEQKVRLTKVAVNQWTRAMLAPSPLERVIELIYELNQVPIQAGGWGLNLVNLTGNELVLSWANEGGTTESFYLHRGGLSHQITVGERGQVATETIGLSSITSMDALRVEDLKLDAAVKMGLVSYNQRTGYDWTLGKTEPITGVSTLSDGTSFKAPIKSFSFSMTGKGSTVGLLALVEDLRVLRSFRVLSIDVRINKSGVGSWKIEGVVYDK